MLELLSFHLEVLTFCIDEGKDPKCTGVCNLL